ncbi:MAG TPA: hypothetical protein VEP89_16105 [Draconibacterium sp.]|nr:hypothetical protein [Draconibacterium sp.]
MVLCIGLSTMRVFSVDLPQQSAFEKRLEELEIAVIRADRYTSYCQRSTNWHFPAELYSYIESARCCYQKGTKKQLKKANDYLQLLSISIDLIIKGEEGYWRDYNCKIWIDPIPPVPDCAMQEFLELKVEITTKVSSSPNEILEANPVTSQLVQPGQSTFSRESP